MRTKLTRHRLSALATAFSCALALVSTGASRAHTCDGEIHACRDFCVGPQCFGSEVEDPWEIIVPEETVDDLTFDFVLKFNAVQLPVGSSVLLLEMPDGGGEAVVSITIQRPTILAPVLVLTYKISTALVGQLFLGSVQVNGVNEHWVVQRKVGMRSKIAVDRDGTPYDTGNVTLQGDPAKISLGILGVVGDPGLSASASPPTIQMNP